MPNPAAADRPRAAAALAALADFTAHLRDYERLRPSTVHNYATYVGELLAFLPPAEADAAAAGDLGAEQLSGFLRAGADRGLASSSLQYRWYAVHAYFRYLRHRGYAGPSPLERVRAPRALPVARRDYTREEAESILAAAQRSADGGTRRGQYDLAVMATLRYTGVRRSELLDAALADLDLGRRELTVLGKGRKRRTVPLPHAYVDLMRWYLEQVRPRLPGSQALFANPRAYRAGPFWGRTEGQTLQRVVGRYGREAGVAGPHMPHRWRHTYATHLLRQGVDVAVVQQLLGHSSISTTAVYLHLVRDDLLAGVDRAFG